MTCFEIHGLCSRLLFLLGHQAQNTPPNSCAYAARKNASLAENFEFFSDMESFGVENDRVEG